MTAESNMPGPKAETPGQTGAVADSAKTPKPSNSAFKQLPPARDRGANGKPLGR